MQAWLLFMFAVKWKWSQKKSKSKGYSFQQTSANLKHHLVNKIPLNIYVEQRDHCVQTEEVNKAHMKSRLKLTSE